MFEQSPPPSNGDSIQPPNPNCPPGVPVGESKIIAWSQAEAARNAARHAAECGTIGAALTPEQGLRKLAEADREETAVRDRLARIEAEKEQRRRIETLMERNGVPKKYRSAAFDGLPRIPEILREQYRQRSEDLRSLIQRPGIVALLGPWGTGKTYLVCALVNTLCQLGRYAMYAEAMDYFCQLQETYDNGSKVPSSSVEAKFLKPELVALDAMEERADTAWNDRMLVRLINKLYAAEKSVVLVSNETERAFNERVGPSIADRIRDDGCKIVCDWQSLRGRIAPLPGEVIEDGTGDVFA